MTSAHTVRPDDVEPPHRADQPGTLRGRLDPSARVIRWFERLGWAYDVRRPTGQRPAAERFHS